MFLFIVFITFSQFFLPCNPCLPVYDRRARCGKGSKRVYLTVWTQQALYLYGLSRAVAQFLNPFLHTKYPQAQGNSIFKHDRPHSVQVREFIYTILFISCIHEMLSYRVHTTKGRYIIYYANTP